MEINMNISANELDKVSVDAAKLSSNFGEIAYSCGGNEGAQLKSAIIDRFPLATWLLNTPMARTMREKSRSGLAGIHKDSNKWVMDVPPTFWTEPAKSTKNECCWVPFDFARCDSNVPLNILCLKDCDSVFDSLVYDVIRISGEDAVPGIARSGERLAEVNERIAKMSMAFLTAQNIVLGLDNTYTDTLKPFHGLLQVLENPAIAHIYGGSILGGFDSLGCRLDVVGGGGVIWVNPIIKSAIEAEVREDRDGNMPLGWERRNGELYFKGRPLREDKIVPVDMTAGTGEAWVLDGDSVGTFLASDLMTRLIKEGGIDTSENNCGASCTYYYNFGATFGNNANRLAVITDIPVRSACLDSLSDLTGFINPNTLIPA